MRHILMLPIVLSLSACSTLGTVLWRPTSSENMPNKLVRGERPTVTALSMDASRRLVMSQLKESPRWTCSEPPPDAASTVLAKSALEGTAKGGGGEYGGKLNDEFATTVLALAQRSSNVEIWRTTSSTYCTLLMNGWIDHAKTYLEKSSAFIVKVDDPKQTQPRAEQPKGEKLAIAKAELAASKLAIQKIERDKKRAEADVKIAEARSDANATRDAKIAVQEIDKQLADATFLKAKSEDAVAANQ